MKKTIYKYFALLSAGAALTGLLYTGTAEAAVPKKEAFSTTCQMLRDDAAKTTVIDHGKLHIIFGAVNKDDRVICQSDNILAAHNGGSSTFLEGNIEKTTIIGGKKTTVNIPYYILRDGRNISCFMKNGEEWKMLPSSAITNLIEKGYGLQELFADNKTAECLNETEKGRTVVFYTDPLPMTELFYSLVSAANIFPAPDFGPDFRRKVRPTEIYVRQDYTGGIISDINADVTWLVQDYLKQHPQALTADEEQSALRKVLAKSEMNFHISVSNTDKKLEFHDVPADAVAFGIQIPWELLSEQQLKEQEKAAKAEETDEDSQAEEE
ncbi:MAG: hypothetical protein Q4D07_01405 [Selenomonadaceae bacterium]|nr:hypothetical protein [Selenomonadaceae bacterium]